MLQPRLCSLIFLLAACGGESQGQVTVTAYGESFIEQGIPASEVGDGWAVTFTRFSVSLSGVVVAGASVAVPASVDLVEPSSGQGQELGSVSVDEGDYTDASFTIARVEVEGSATRGSVEKTFSWVFDDATRYSGCETTTAVSDGGNATFQITVHADHLLYDSVVADEPQLLFQALADADEDVDGEISQAELARTDIGAYDPGSESGVSDLWSYLRLLVRTLGHVDGEGHCRAEAVD